MPRILGVDLPNDKPTHISLRYIMGIGPTLALKVCETARVDPQRRGALHLRLPVAPDPVAPVEPVERHEGLAARGHELHRTQGEFDVLNRVTDRAGAVVQHIDLPSRRQLRLKE